jgi:hypothetical protein
MTGSMPTRDGDVVVSSTGTEPALCTVWRVETDGQQAPGPATHASIAHGCDTALKLAAVMTRESRGGTVFPFDQRTLTWTKPSH